MAPAILPCVEWCESLQWMTNLPGGVRMNDACLLMARCGSWTCRVPGVFA